MNIAQNETGALYLSCSTLQIHTHTHTSCLIRSYRSASQGRRLVCHFLLPHREQNQEARERLRPRMQPESLYLCENKRLPADLLLSTNPPNTHTVPRLPFLHPAGPTAPVAAYLGILIRDQGLWKPRTRGQKTWKPFRCRLPWQPW